ncbi:hypothetical protein HZS_231 [Henneguya salminicola]|nr:hypothetical protein HZS_231 [Henneguya salminicola]
MFALVKAVILKMTQYSLRSNKTAESLTNHEIIHMSNLKNARQTSLFMIFFSREKKTSHK